MNDCITVTVDYHDQNCRVRYRNGRTGQERLTTVPTTRADLDTQIERAAADGRAHGCRVVWIQESTSGWARVQELIAGRLEFVLANVLQMPQPPKGRRQKTDTIDTARLQREFLNGSLPRAATPPAWWRQVRRLVALRENLVRRRTALRNSISRYLAHETWVERDGLWAQTGQRRLQKLAARLPGWDGPIVACKQEEMALLEKHLEALEAEFTRLHADWPEARRLDAVKGIGIVAAVSIAARIGPIERFADAEALIAYAGLAPGVRQSDQTRRYGRIGGGGTDVQLRHYLIEASVWARQLPRYRSTYQRVAKRRGNKIGRLVVARLLLRSIFKVLRDGVAFDEQGPAARRAEVIEA
jgi:transposase